mmetsp:Transcript_18939/g.46917  ORF Transcript_18939/g.46917 Transcript_18939/m.46917 type:complete len:255 (-) Transcript_18939:157-921(-)
MSSFSSSVLLSLRFCSSDPFSFVPPLTSLRPTSSPGFIMPSFSSSVLSSVPFCSSDSFRFIFASTPLGPTCSPGFIVRIIPSNPVNKPSITAGTFSCRVARDIRTAQENARNKDATRKTRHPKTIRNMPDDFFNVVIPSRFELTGGKRYSWRVSQPAYTFSIVSLKDDRVRGASFLLSGVSGTAGVSGTEPRLSVGADSLESSASRCSCLLSSFKIVYMKLAHIFPLAYVQASNLISYMCPANEKSLPSVTGCS